MIIITTHTFSVVGRIIQHYGNTSIRTATSHYHSYCPYLAVDIEQSQQRSNNNNKKDNDGATTTTTTINHLGYIVNLGVVK